MSWIEAFTIAIVEENYTRIDALIETMPHFETLEEATSAAALIQEALALVEKEKSNTFDAMQKLKKTRHFLESSDDAYFQEYRG